MAMKSSSVCALEPKKIAKTKWSLTYGTPCSFLRNPDSRIKLIPTVFSCELCIGGRLSISISRTNINIIRNIDNVLELSEGIRPWGEISGPGSDTRDIHTRALQLSQLEHQPPTTRGSNEGYPKVHNHGETQFHVERPWGQHPFSIVS